MSKPEPKDIRIRPVAAEEVGAIADLAKLIWNDAYKNIISAQQITYMIEDRYSAERMRAELVSGEVWWDVACCNRNDEELRLGFASTQFTDEPGTLKLDKLYIHPEYQRIGVGRMLIEHVSQRARDLSCNRVILSVNKHNARAIEAYKSCGFTLSASVFNDIGHGFVMDDYIFERNLEPVSDQ